MNVLAHCKASLEVLKGRKLTDEDEALLFLGSTLPDISEFGLVKTEETHDNGFDFLKSLAKKYHYLGVGVIFHGEKTKGLDYYAHGSRGYIAKKQKEIMKVVRHYKKVFPKKTDFPMIAHIIIEFCFEYLTAEKDPEIVSRFRKANKNPILIMGIYNFANFFNIKRKYIKTILRITKTNRIEKFTLNFRTLKGTAHNFQNFIFLKNVRDKGKEPNWLDRLTKSSYGYLKSRIQEKQFEQMFARCIEVVRKDYNPLMNKAVKNMKKIVKEKKL